MECKLTGEALNICEKVFEASSEQPFETELVLPDYCPDIGKILKCQATPSVESKTINRDRINIEGIISIRVMYTDERSKCVRSYECEKNFSAVFNAKEYDSEISILAETVFDYANCRAVTQRKLEVRGAFTLCVKVLSLYGKKFISEASGDGIKTHSNILSVRGLKGEVQHPFVINDTLELAGGKTSIGTVLRSEASAYVIEAKPVAGKLVVRGEALVRVLYCNDYDSSQLDTMEYTIPFHQIVDISNADEKSICSAEAAPVSLKLGIKTDDDGEYRVFNCELRMLIHASVYCDSEIAYVDDAYSTECELETELGTIALDSLSENTIDENTVKFNVSLGEDTEKIYDVWCNVRKASSLLTENLIKISAPVSICVLARTANGENVLIEKSETAEHTVKLKDGNAEFASSSVTARSCSYNFLSKDKLEVRVNLNYSAQSFIPVRAKAVSAIFPDRAHLKDPSSRPAITVYYASSGESLWDIAKAHNSSVEHIMSENDMTKDVLTSDKALLIS